MSEFRVVIKTNAKQVAANIEKRIKRLQDGGKSVVREVAEYGKSYAQSIAPVDTGATIRAIKWVKGKTPASATVIFGNSGHPERKNKIKGQYGLTTYMNFYGNPSHWHSGNPRFIQATRDKVWEKFRRKMRFIVTNK